MLDFVEKTLDQMPFLVPVFVIFTLLCAIFAGRNDRFGVLVRNEMQKIVRIIRTVSDHALEFIVGQ